MSISTLHSHVIQTESTIRLVLLAILAIAGIAPLQSNAQSTAKDDDQWRIQMRESQPLALRDEGKSPQETSASSTTETTKVESEPATILWKGFLYGDQHFRDKPRPVGSPLYFEDPFINSDMRFVYLYHDFPKQSVLKGGDLNVYALQLRIALTERLAFLATCDGISHLESPILNDDTGWNDLALGLKYAFWVDHSNDFIASGGLKWKLSNGHADTLHGNVDELVPFITAYKGWGKLNFIANAEGRIAMDEHRGNHLFHWNGHVSYEIIDRVFFPLFEVHGVHYLSDGDHLPFNDGGLDYANLGSNDVAGKSVFWGGIGARWNIMDHVSWGAVWEFPMQSVHANDIFEQRVSTNLILTF